MVLIFHQRIGLLLLLVLAPFKGGMHTVMRAESVFAVVLALEKDALETVRGSLCLYTPGMETYVLLYRLVVRSGEHGQAHSVTPTKNEGVERADAAGVSTAVSRD